MSSPLLFLCWCQRRSYFAKKCQFCAAPAGYAPAVIRVDAGCSTCSPFTDASDNVWYPDSSNGVATSLISIYHIAWSPHPVQPVPHPL